MRPRRRDDRIARSKRNLRIAALGTLTVLGLGGVLIWMAVEVNPVLGPDLCPSPDRVVGTTIMLVDATDPWSEIRKVAVAREVTQITETIPRFTRVSLHVVSPQSTAQGPPGPVANLCNPGTPAQVREDARRRGFPVWLISNRARARARFDSAFAGVIDSLVAQAARAQPQDRSPIIETLRFAALSSSSDDSTSIIMISDMYQNSGLCSFYRPPGCVRRVVEVSDPLLGGTHDLAASKIEIFLLSPAGGEKVPRDVLLQFWYEYFRRQGAMIIGVKRIEQ